MRDEEGKPVITIPPVVGVVVVRVQPGTIVVTVGAEEVRIAIGIAQDIFYATTPRILSGLNLIRHCNALISRAKYLHFL